ncbi:MAG: glycogen-binding domain-containing protein [Gemmatimonadaceae bacterium]
MRAHAVLVRAAAAFAASIALGSAAGAQGAGAAGALTLGVAAGGPGSAVSAGGSGALLAPPLAGVRLSLSAAGVMEGPAVDAPIGAEPGAFAIAARASRRFGRSGLWLGADLAGASASAGVRPEDRRSVGASAGVWRQLGSLLLGASVGARATPNATRYVHRPAQWYLSGSRFDTLLNRVVEDTAFFPAYDSLVSAQRRWSEGEASAYWSRGRAALDVAVGARLSAAGVDAARWARVGGTLALTRRVALVARGETAPPRIAAPGAELLAGGRRRFALGLRFAALGAPTAARPVEIQPVATAFRAEHVAAGRYRVTVRVPRARTVELSGDFTAWRPVALRREGEDTWEATFDLAPGTYRVNLRVDGDRWEPPPGLPAVPDDFAGAVGIVVVQ